MLGELVIDEATYAARLRGRLLELTYKEFELLKYLAQHAGRVFTRAQLLQEVWGYDFFACYRQLARYRPATIRVERRGPTALLISSGISHGPHEPDERWAPSPPAGCAGQPSLVGAGVGSRQGR